MVRRRSFLIYSAERTAKAHSFLKPLQDVLKMSSVRSKTRQDVSHHWLSGTFKDACSVADSVTAVHSVLLKSLYVFKRRCINKGLKCPKLGELDGHTVGRPWPICWFLHKFRTSLHNKAKMYWHAIVHGPRASSDFQQCIICKLVNSFAKTSVFVSVNVGKISWNGHYTECLVKGT
jgi:hypothetical protein